MNEILHLKSFWGTYVVLGISFDIWGFNIFIFLLLFYFFNVLSDFSTGILASRAKGKLDSKIGIDGALKKCIIVCFVLLLLLLTTGLNSLFDFGSYRIFIGAFPLLVFAIFNFLELYSNLENLSVIFADEKEGMVFSFLKNISEKIFNTSLDKLKVKAEEKIEERFNK